MVGSDIIDMEATYYISGPMSGIPEFNYPYFDKVAKRLRAFNLDVRSPHEIETPPSDIHPDKVWDWCMVRCMKLLKEADSIVLLPGWTRSQGAKIELEEALRFNFTTYFYLDPPGRLVNMTRTNHVR